MEDNTMLAVIAVLALGTAWLCARRIEQIQREIDFIVDGDIETLKLKRKLEAKGRQPDE